MPKAAPRICMQSGCKNYATSKGYCKEHQSESRQYDRLRGNAHQRGYSNVWRKARATYLHSHPLCVACEQQNRVTPASVVDHIKAHKGDQDLFWDTSNWQSLCQSCHNSKTAKEDMGSWPSSNQKN